MDNIDRFFLCYMFSVVVIDLYDTINKMNWVWWGRILAGIFIGAFHFFAWLALRFIIVRLTNG